jgi:hypothetical protein
MRDLEILLRGFAMLINGSRYAPPMTQFLNGFSDFCRGLRQTDVERLEQIFESFLSASSSLSATAFYGKVSGKFSVLTFEAVFAAVSADFYGGRADGVGRLDPMLIERLKDDGQFTAATQARTTSKANVALRLQRAREIMLG